MVSWLSKETVIIGHRGVMKRGFRENSVEAFLEALKEGADGVELDVRLSENREVIVMHDPLISKHESEVRKLKTKESLSLKNPNRGSEEVTLTLNRVFEVLPKTALIDIDLKEIEAVGEVLETVSRYEAEERTLLSAPNTKTLEEVRKLNGDILVSFSPTSLKSLFLIPVLKERFELFAVSFPMEALLFMSINAVRHYLKLLKDYGLKIALWTLQEYLFFWDHPLIGLSDLYDLIITGDPERMINYLRGLKILRSHPRITSLPISSTKGFRFP